MEDLIRRALITAAVYHKGGERKGSRVPYIVHPYEVAMILKENGMEASIIAAGLLHDTLEDTEMTIGKLRDLFGEEILNLVLGASEELKDRDNTPWDIRKKHTIEYLKKAPLEVKYIACADKLSNIRSISSDYRIYGEKLWDKFMESDRKINGKGYSREYKKNRQQWYYENLIKSLDELKGLRMYQEFKDTVRRFFSF